MAETVAVVGSGMAGLAAAYGCRRAGFHVTLFEARSGHGMDAHAMAVAGGNVDLPLRVMSPRNWQSVLALAAEVGLSQHHVSALLGGRRGQLPDGWQKVLDGLGLELVVRP
ncbi:MAG: FAD-dependent oxidoreductase, partial [Haliea sp.]